MSCLRIRSSSRSSGPSYTSPTVTEKGKSFSFVLAEPFAGSCNTSFAGSPIYLSPKLQRHAHRFAHFVHGRTCNLARLGRASLQNIPGQPRILLIFLASLL